MALGYLISILFLGVYYYSHSYLHTKKGLMALESKKGKTSALLPMLILFLVARLIAAAACKGYPNDIGCWSAWGNRMNEVPLSQFYAPDYFCDYPPGYLYILGAVSKTSRLLGLSQSGYEFMLRFPAIFADMLIALIIYKYGGKRMSEKAALLLSGLYLFSPVFFYDTAVWGQIESVLLLFLLVSLILFQKEKYQLATLVYALAILLKPQGILLAPMILVLLLESRSWKKILSSILLAFAGFMAFIIPFSPAWQEETGISLFLHLCNPLWMVEKYLSTMGSYAYFSVNATNFYAAINLNWVPMSKLGEGILASSFNYIILSLGVLGSIFLYFKIKNKDARIWLSGFFLFSFLFTFAVQMHERYIVLSIVFLLFAYLTTRNKHLLALFAGFSCVGFLNLYAVLSNFFKDNFWLQFPIMFPISLCEVLLFAYGIWVIWRYFLHGQDAPAETMKETALPFMLKQKKKAKTKSSLTTVQPKSLNEAEGYMVRLDYLLLAGIVLVYSVVAFTNLGDTTAPQTYYQPASVGETVTVTLKNTEEISEINYYCGIGKVSKDNGLTLSYSADGSNWTEFGSPVCSLGSVFCWHNDPINPPVKAKYLRLTSTSTEYALFEAGFRNTEGELVSLASVTETGYAAFDEPGTVTNQPSYENGTYFDEIYHARTAFEHLHLMPYYETTHPPLGKLIMSLGVALFGMTPFGWRFMGTLVGVLMLPLFYLLIKKLFGRTRYAFLGTLLFAFDFMHFSLTRIATIDSFPVLFIIGMYYFMYRFALKATAYARREEVSTKELMLPLLFSGICMGLGCASKWTAIYAAAGLAVEFFVILGIMKKSYSGRQLNQFWDFAQNICMWCLLFFVAIPSVLYTLSYLPISLVDGYGNVVGVMLDNQEYMFGYHSDLKAEHSFSSQWYSWPFVYKPIWVYKAPDGSVPAGYVGSIAIFQNPVLSWVGIAAFFYSLYVGKKKKDYRVLFLLIGLLAQYLPWMGISRLAFQYHYFATMVFVILFVVYAMKDLEERYPRFQYVSLGFVVLCLALFVAFYPVLSGVPATKEYVESLKWFDSWIF